MSKARWTENSREADLKRERTALRGKIKRRHDTAMSLRNEAFRMEQQLRRVEAELSEYQPAPRSTP